MTGAWDTSLEISSCNLRGLRDLESFQKFNFQARTAVASRWLWGVLGSGFGVRSARAARRGTGERGCFGAPLSAVPCTGCAGSRAFGLLHPAGKPFATHPSFYGEGKDNLWRVFCSHSRSSSLCGFRRLWARFPVQPLVEYTG